jgi:Mg2+-importing ATPase
MKTHYESLFHTGWFVESLLTQTLIVHIIRTNRIPFLESRASPALLGTTLAIMAIAAYLPFSPLAGSLGLVPLPKLFWLFMLLTLLAYASLTHSVKIWFIRKYGSD